MDSFENLIALLLRRDGWWTTTGYKVELSKSEKSEIGTPTSPRWEVDVLAYKGRTNEVLAVECKSFLDSRGVVFSGGMFDPPDRYKLFTREGTRKIVLQRIAEQLVDTDACGPSPQIRLGLATGHLARVCDRVGLRALFDREGWQLLDDDWIREKLVAAADLGYENEAAIVVAKILARNR